MNELQLFQSTEFGQIRTIEENGKVLFCGSDVAKALGYAKPQNAIAAHCKGALKRGIPTNGGIQEMLLIPEGDVYRLTAKSELPGAVKFESWIFDEVLPTIRQHGEYISPQKSRPRLGETNAAARIIKQTLKEAGMAPEFIAVAIKSLYAPVGVEIPLLGVTVSKKTYDATTIAQKLGITSKSGNPHNQAVSAIIAQLDINESETAIVPFQDSVSGHAGTTVQYTDSVINKVSKWLEDRQKPSEVSQNGKSFKIFYK